MRRLGVGCLLLALAGWGVSIPLHCAGRAAMVGGFALLDGALFGLCLAMITRSRQAGRIYLWLALAALTFWPIMAEWPLWHGMPVGNPLSVHPWIGAPGIVYNYYDILRFYLFILGFPYPFARFGQHGPDVET